MILGVRPRDLSIVSMNNENTIQLKVDLVEHVGSEQLLKVKLMPGDTEIGLIADAEQHKQNCSKHPCKHQSFEN